MSNRVSVVLLLLSLVWTDPAVAQVRSPHSPAWVLSVHDGSRLTANVNRIPLRLVLEELARQAPLRLSVSGEWHDHLVTADFHALPLDEALAQLLAGLSYAIVYAPERHEAGSAGTRQIVELIVLEKAPATKDSGISVASAVTSITGPGQGATLDTPPEWTAALQHPDTQVRLGALQRWAEQGRATPLDPLTHALVDPDESVRAKAQELVERVWAAKAEAGAR